MDFGLSTHAAPRACWHGRVLGTTLTRRSTTAGSTTTAPPLPHLPSKDEVDRRLGKPCRAAVQLAGARADEEPDREAFARLAARSNSFLAELEGPAPVPVPAAVKHRSGTAAPARSTLPSGPGRGPRARWPGGRYVL
jgi:hypothetical protein